MNYAKFEEHALLYGSDVNTWPELLQNAARQALATNPSWQHTLNDMREFETAAHKRPTVFHDDSFAERIIAKANSSASKSPRIQNLADAFDELTNYLPFNRPAYAMAMLAIVGFGLGIVSEPDSVMLGDSSTIFYDTRGIL